MMKNHLPSCTPRQTIRHAIERDLNQLGSAAAHLGENQARRLREVYAETIGRNPQSELRKKAS